MAGPTDTTNDATQNPLGPSTLPGNIDLQTTLLTLNSQMSTMAEILFQLCTNSSDGQGRKRSRPKRTHEAATSSSSADSDSSSANDSDDEPAKKRKDGPLQRRTKLTFMPVRMMMWKTCLKTSIQKPNLGRKAKEQ